MRLDGAVLWVLLLLPLAIALLLWLLWRHHHLDVGITVAVIFGLAAVGIGLATLWVTWAAYRGPRRADGSAGDLSVAQLADQLAVVVGDQWSAEVVIRRLNDPYPLPVSWIAADPSLTDTWESLVKLATSGAGWPPPPPEGTWATDPDDLAGEGGELSNVQARVPTGRLVVLGEPGSGKTMLMVRLVLDLLARRTGGSPVPFLASIASWNPAEQNLQVWLAAQLMTDHPSLADPPPVGMTEDTQAAALLTRGLILPVLDGLDELPDEIRGSAVSRINNALRPGEQVVVSCRTEQYRDVIRPQSGPAATLRGAAAVQLCPLDAAAVRGYLCDDAAGPVARARWEPVLKLLDTNTPLGQVLSTPLMVGLARMIYNPRPGELAGTLRDPGELWDPVNKKEVESLLFHAFIPAAYRHNPDGRWKVQDAEKWFTFLAHHLEYTIGKPDFAWWQLLLAVPRLNRILALVGAVAVVGAMGGFALLTHSGIGTAISLVVLGLLIWFGVTRVAGKKGSPNPARGIRWKPPGSGAVLLGLGVAALMGSLAFAGLGLVFVAIFMSGFGVMAGVITWLVTQRGALLDVETATSPPALLARDRKVATIAGAATFAVCCVGFTLMGIMVDFAAGVDATKAFRPFVLGLIIGIMAGAAVSFSVAAWPFYHMARIWFALHRRQLPWPLMDFLADAHRRGVLRQAGAVYQFRHIELQHWLANRAADKQ